MKPCALHVEKVTRENKGPVCKSKFVTKNTCTTCKRVGCKQINYM